jgi:hypothetical protein
MNAVAKRQKLENFNFRLEPELKAAFAAAAEAADRPAAQVLRDFMRAYVEKRERDDLKVAMRRQAAELGRLAQDPHSDEAQILRELDANLDDFLRSEPDY